MAKRHLVAAIIGATFSPLVTAVSSQSYSWKNVKIGGGGGFVPGIVFNPSQQVTKKAKSLYLSTNSKHIQGLAFARTDIGGAYKLNSDDSWTPLLDFVDDARWNYWGVDALATDPVQPNRLYLVRNIIFSLSETPTLIRSS